MPGSVTATAAASVSNTSIPQASQACQPAATYPPAGGGRGVPGGQVLAEAGRHFLLNRAEALGSLLAADQFVDSGGESSSIATNGDAGKAREYVER